MECQRLPTSERARFPGVVVLRSGGLGREGGREGWCRGGRRGTRKPTSFNKDQGQERGTGGDENGRRGPIKGKRKQTADVNLGAWGGESLATLAIPAPLSKIKSNSEPPGNQKGDASEKGRQPFCALALE